MVEDAVSDLVKEVKVLLDRNQESAGLLAPDDSDTLSQAELIESKIVDAARIRFFLMLLRIWWNVLRVRML